LRAPFSVYIDEGHRHTGPSHFIKEVQMESRFLAAIDAAVEQALPGGWPRVPRQRLPARGSIQARHAFRLAGDGGRAPYLALVALPPFTARSPAVESDLVALIDHVLARGASLLLLYQHEDDPDGWVRERVDFPHPRFLCLACAPSDRAERAERDDEYTAAPFNDWPAPLSGVIRDLWSGDLVYRGPMEGMQTVGIELMKDRCWRCRAAIDTVTGIVFPDREVSDWSLPDWAYFQQLLELARIPDPLIPAVQAAIDVWRAAGDRHLTVIGWRYSKTVEYAYWAAECTACGAFQGDWPVMEERQLWLGNLESRLTGRLSYRPLRLDVPRQALQELTWGCEVNPHACRLGWRPAADPELARSPKAAQLSATRSGTPAAAVPGHPAAAVPGHPAAAMPGHPAAAVPGHPAAAVPGHPAAAASGSTAVAQHPAGPAVNVLAPLSPGLAPSPSPPGPTAAPILGPLHRLGEILAAWLGASLGRSGWSGAPRRPPAPGAPTPSPSPAPAARPASGH
jgi:hypothetical protein